MLLSSLKEPLFSQDVHGPALFAGDDSSLTLGLLAGLREARQGQPLVIVDGSNAFDPFLVADLARKLGITPKGLLDEIRISRVFTCHQLEALLCGRLQQAVQRFRSRAVFFSGLLDPLLDKEVAPGEAFRIFRFIPPVLRRLAADGVLTICACPPPQQVPGREGLFTELCKTAAWVFEVTRDADEDVVHVVCRKPHAAEWRWEPGIGMIVPRRWW